MCCLVLRLDDPLFTLPKTEEVKSRTDVASFDSDPAVAPQVFVVLEETKKVTHA
jgi:hypothetical protein